MKNYLAMVLITVNKKRSKKEYIKSIYNRHYANRDVIKDLNFSIKDLKLRENENFIMSNNNVLTQELLSPIKM